jgi:catechol 2,3-dioxygenase-like lactoylglutathione lyase family enzyme
MQPRITVIALGVDDLERAVAFYRDGLGLKTDGIVGTELEHGTERGIALGAIETQPGRYRKAEVTDPEGNRISFSQALGPGND